VQEIRTLVVDDFKGWRDFARGTLGKIPGLLIIGEADDGLEAIEKAQELQPDLVILDIGIPIIDGFEVAQEIRRTCRKSKIIFLSGDHFADAIEESLHAEVSAYVLKSRATVELVPAVEAAFNDGQMMHGK
jgi:DNA-binding NarL/FixJ family response regulator